MVQAKSTLASFSDYLTYDDGTDSRYELTYGDLVEVPPESDENVLISRALDRVLSELVGFRRVRTHQLAIELPGQPKNRYPDITVLRPEHLEQLQSLGKSAITLDMAPPLLVVEVVSPGPDNRRRDYLDKRNQYEWRGIPEYWILDPQDRRVTVLVMDEGAYVETSFEGDQAMVSPMFPELQLTVEDLLSPRINWP
jgi:Uma2 family endonuclease